MQLSSVVEFRLVGYAGRVPGKTDTTRPDPSYDPTRPWLLPDPGTRHQPGIPGLDTTSNGLGCPESPTDNWLTRIHNDKVTCLAGMDYWRS